MAGRGSGPDFVESLARGLDVLRCFDESHRQMSLAEVAAGTGLARPTARRLLLTLQELGYVGSVDGAFSLTPKCLTLGTAYVASLGLWDIARPHLEALVRTTGESSSMAQLDGSDIVYVARVSVPKIIALRVDIGTLFPAPVTSQGKVLLAALSPDELASGPEGPVPLVGRAVAYVARAVATSLEPELTRSAPAAGRWPTRSSPPASAPSPSRFATARHRAGGHERHRPRRGDHHRAPARAAPAEAPPRRRRRQRRLGHLAVSAARRGPAAVNPARTFRASARR